MFDKVLVANRGEIACRIIRTLKKMQVKSVAVYSEADAHARHVLDADEAFLIGPAPAAESYLDADKILSVAKVCGAAAIHPGYGFLSENHEFARQCESEGIRFIGPDPAQILDFGLKHRARELALEFDLPLLPGSGLLASKAEAAAQAARIGYPVMLKSSAGGGGIGMALCMDEGALAEAWDRIRRLSENNFNDTGMFVEKFIQHARHVEVQVFGDGKGEALVLGDRDCSVQRRNQKIIEETPAPGLSPALRQRLHLAASRLARGVGYRSAGTVEFIYDADEDAFYFLEVNTRLQVEHCVTEAVCGVDLVEWMVWLAADDLPDLQSLAPTPKGVAIEVRIYAEDPGQAFLPSTGLLTEVAFPEGVRVDSWVGAGTEVTAYYDPLLAKLTVHKECRANAVAALTKALSATRVRGVETNLFLLGQIAAAPDFAAGNYTTRIAARIDYAVPTVRVDAPGMQTTIQDYPGRVGYWAVGVPPSGPMDSLNHRLANRIVGNDQNAAALEITVEGPQLTFNTDAVVALTGAEMSATLNGSPVQRYIPISVKAGSVLLTGTAQKGQRAYLAIRGGIDLPCYMGSRSTFTLGRFGGHCGRSLVTGDVLWIDSMVVALPKALPQTDIPQFPDVWEIGVLYGPHGAPDFFTHADMETFFGTDWEVHYNSSRTGVRLKGPSPQWAREDGGEAGLHPSNIHDNAYAVGAVDFTGDMPVILGPDGPSLGGFVCPATIVAAELWKTGQLRPGDRVRFRQVSREKAACLEARQEAFIARLSGPYKTFGTRAETVSLDVQPAVVKTFAPKADGCPVVYRVAGDKYLLIEYGDQVLDLVLRFRVHALMLELEKMRLDGVLDLTPGIRSLQIHYDNRILPLPELLDILERVETQIAGKADRKVPARIVHLPLSWDDVATHKAIDIYTRSVRPDAPWCPSNIEFIRRINGLDSIDDVKKVVFGASYLVMGLGDVYLGAPVATPLDPRNRLVTTKYNPARTWTPENAVGIGGAYLCVYGMEGPGGYQFVGRTLQMWNRYHTTREFKPGKPWLLRFFDQIRFYPVSHDELMQMRRDFPYGLAGIKIEETTFDLDAYEQFIRDNQDSIQAFKQKQQAAFEAERQQWIKNGQLNYHSEDPVPESSTESLDLLPGCLAVDSAVAGSLWQLATEAEQTVQKGDTIAVLESMKMEVVLKAPCTGTIRQVFCRPGAMVVPGQRLFSIEPATLET